MSCLVQSVFQVHFKLCWREVICCDDETDKQQNLNVARYLIKTKFAMNLNEVFNVKINEKIYRIKLVEDFHGPKEEKDKSVSDQSDSKEDECVWESTEEDEVGELCGSRPRRMK